MDQLSNCELLELFTLYTSDGAGHFMNFLAVFSAYLVAGYIAAGRLGKVTVISISALYVLVVSMTATGSYLTIAGAVYIAREITMRSSSSADLLVSAAATMSGITGKTMLFLNPIVQLVACAGSIVFVLLHRSEQAGDEV